MPNVTLSMIVKNEEKYLRECLESIKDVADEIVIVDTGSIDKTIEIAEEFNAKVYHFKWVNDFSAARNFALSKSNGNWILYLDADERLSEQSIAELKTGTESSKKIGIKCLVNSIDSKSNNSQRMKYIRLFKNDSNIKFTGKAHEQIEKSLLQNNYNIIDSEIEIIHLGYDVPKNQLKEKAKRNLELLLLNYEKEKTPYLAYQIANSYSVLEDKNYKDFYYSEALKTNSLAIELRTICFVNLAESEMLRGNIEKAKKYVDEGLSENKEHAILNLIATQVYGKLKKYDKAIKYCKNAYLQNNENGLKNGKVQNQIIKIDDLKIINQGILLSVISNDEQAFNYFFNLLLSKKENLAEIIIKLLKQVSLNYGELTNLINITNNDNLELLLKLFENYQHTNQKLKYLENIFVEFRSNAKFLSYYGSFLMNQNKNLLAQEIFESAIELENYDPAIILYLSSLYVKENKFEKLIILLEKTELAAQNNSILRKNLNLLKEKLMPLLSKSLS